MSDVTTALIGAVAGLVGSIPGTLLTHHLASRREVNLNRIRRQRLNELLEDPKWEWRRMNTLASAIGCDEATTSALLLEIGALPSTSETDMWSLEGRGGVATAPPADGEPGSRHARDVTSSKDEAAPMGRPSLLVRVAGLHYASIRRQEWNL